MKVELETVKQIIAELIEDRISDAEYAYSEGYTSKDYFDGEYTALCDLRDTFGGDCYIEETLEHMKK